MKKSELKQIIREIVQEIESSEKYAQFLVYEKGKPTPKTVFLPEEMSEDDALRYLISKGYSPSINIHKQEERIQF